MKDLSFLALSDIYGDALTEKQRDMLTDYYARDFSLSEIGDNYDVSRQAVHFAIKQAEKSLIGYEEKFGVCAFVIALQTKVDELEQAVTAGEDVTPRIAALREFIRSKYGTVR